MKLWDFSESANVFNNNQSKRLLLVIVTMCYNVKTLKKKLKSSKPLPSVGPLEFEIWIGFPVPEMRIFCNQDASVRLNINIVGDARNHLFPIFKSTLFAYFGQVNQKIILKRCAYKVFPGFDFAVSSAVLKAIHQSGCIVRSVELLAGEF